MGSKKQIIAVVLLAALLGGGVLGYSWQRNRADASTFSVAGYVHIADPEQDVKQIAFQGGTVWKHGLSNTVSFADIQGNKQKVSTESFVHFDNQALAALSRGVVVDLNDLDTARMTNYYSVAPAVAIENVGNGYALQGGSAGLTMSDFLWKVSEKKYMLVSSSIECRFSEEDVRAVEDYVEITYIDEGVIQLQSKENVWQTVSDNCLAVLNNGEVVDLSLRNVQDESGEVLMDFSKMVVDTDSGVENTPLTAELLSVWENVIPHFDITAEDGKDGEAGEAGEVGEAGEAGELGEAGENGEGGEAGEAGESGDPGEAGTPGEAGEAGSPGKAGSPGTNGQQGAAGPAGSNGAAGTSGTNGAAGAPGAPGTPGNPGETPTAPTSEVLAMPEFTIENWQPTATGCSGVIKVNKDPKGMLMEKTDEGATSSVYVVDPVTGNRVEITGQFGFQTLDPDGYAFTCSGLKPDREYMLLVDAPFNSNKSGSSTYLRNFVTKIFYTDSVGVYLEAEPSTQAAVNLSVHTRNYSAAISDVTVYLYSSRADAAAAAAGAPGVPVAVKNDIKIKEDGSVSFTGLNGDGSPGVGDALTPNTTYYARVAATVGEAPGTVMMPAQILPLTTLKRQVTLGTPILTPNRTSWGFDVTPTTLTDPDSGVVGYRYEFYETKIVKDENNEDKEVADLEKFVKSVTVRTTDSLTIPLDGSAGGLQAGDRYAVRLVATFNDNEKTYDVSSEFSNPATVTGGQLPNVVYVNKSEINPGLGESGGASGDSSWYDQLDGVIRVLPGAEGSQLMVGNGHVPRVTVRASGYYYVQYPVYLKGQTVGLEKGTYLTATINGENAVEIEISGENLVNLKTKVDGAGSWAEDGTGAVNGMRPGTAYRIIVTGDLTNDGSTATDTGITVGVCVVNTPALTSVATTLSYNEDSIDRTTLKDSVLQLFSQKTEGSLTPQLSRQQQTLTSLRLDALESSTAATPMAYVELTEANYRATLQAVAATEGITDKVKDEIIDKLDRTGSLGELMEAGLPLTEALFKSNSKEFDLTNSRAVYIKVSGVLDYTGLDLNTANQSSYRPLDPNDSTKPDPSVVSVYKNQYTLENYADAVTGGRKAAPTTDLTKGFELIYSVQLGATPDPLPEIGNGIKVERKDTDKDGYADDAYLLTPNYPNGGKLARYITFYVFDAPDWNISEENSWDKDGWSSNLWVFDAASFYDNKHYSYQPLTPVSAVKDGEGLWLAKLRIPVPATGTFAEEMPRVEFIPQTAADYFGTDTAGLNAYNQLLSDAAADTDRKIVPEGNVWQMFLPEGSTEPRTGHQFVFAWTMEYEKKVGSGTATGYYPFEYSTYQSGTNAGLNYYKNIPHSKIVDAPRRAPTIYAMPWQTEFKTDGSTSTQYPVVTWKMFVSDPDGAVVRDGKDTDTALLYPRTNATATGDPLKVGPTTGAEETTVGISSEKLFDETKDTYYWPEKSQEVKILAQVKEITGPVKAALRVQYYTDKYTQAYASGFTNVGLFDKYGTDTQNAYRESTNKNYTANPGTVPTNVHAFTFNYNAESFPKAGDMAGVKLEINVPKGSEGSSGTAAINQYEVTVTGSSSVMRQLNGVRLTFKGAKGSVTLDKYVMCAVDSWEAQWAAEAGGNISWKFRVNIPLELGNVAGEKVDFTAGLIYEDGHEGFFYAKEAVPVSLVRYSDYSMTDDKRQWQSFSGTGVPALSTQTGSVAPRVGSFFTMTGENGTKGNAAWPESWQVSSTRTALWELQHWSTTTNKITPNYANDPLSSARGVDNAAGNAGRYVPRALSFKTMQFDKDAAKSQVTGNALVSGTSKINVPSLVPVITYDEPAGYVNFISVPYSINQGNINAYFTLEKWNGTTYTLMCWKKDSSGIYTWTEVKQGNTSVTNADAYIGQLSQGGGSITVGDDSYNIFTEVSYLTAGQKTECRFEGVAEDSGYKIRAYYWDGKHYRLMNMPQGSELTPNVTTTKTEGIPNVDLRVSYRVLGGYNYKQLAVSVNIPRLTSYYYTLELVGKDEYGKETSVYLDAVSNRTEGRQGVSRDVYDVGPETRTENAPTGELWHGHVTDASSFEVKNKNSANEYPVLVPGSKHIFLEYGKEYQVRVRVYDIGRGPAYEGGTVADDMLANSPKAVTFTVTDAKDTASVTGSFDLKTVTGDTETHFVPTAQFTINPVIRSGSLLPYMTAVVVRARTEGGKTTYADVTNGVTMQWGSLESSNDPWSAYRLIPTGRRTMELSLEGGDYTPGDEFYFYLYGILENGDTSTNALIAQKKLDRETILAGRQLKGNNDASALVSGEPVEVKFNNEVVGSSVLMGWGRATYVSATASAGQVTLSPSGNNVRIGLYNPVQPSAIKLVQWSIVASYTAADGTSGTAETGVVTEALNFAAGGANLSFDLRPGQQTGFAIPNDATDVLYTVTMHFYDGEDEDNLGKSIPMTAVGDNMTVSEADGVYTLSGTLQMRSSGTSTVNAAAGSIFALPQEKRKWGL